MKRGDVVLVDFVYSSGKTSKLRPALVIQSDHNNLRLTNTIVAQITSKLRRLNEPTRLLIDPSTPDGAGSGLHMPSVVTCENILTVEISLIHKVIGRLQASAMQRLDDCLKVALGL